MRLLELRMNGGREPVLEFHPNLTVVRGLSPDARRQVIDAVVALPSGAEPGLDGLLEAHGILFDLSRDTLDILGMSTHLDVLVRPDDLPGSSSNGSGATVTPLFADDEPVDGAVEEEDDDKDEDVEAGDEDAPSADGPDPVEAQKRLDAARAVMSDSQEAYDVTAEAMERAKLERAAASEARQRVATALDKARRERDMARARRDGKTGPEAGSAAAREQELKEQVAGLEESLEALAAGVAELEERDPRPIEVLLDALREPEPTKMIPSAEATALADEFAGLQERLDELERRLQTEGLSMDQLSQRLEDARFELKQAETAVEKPDLGPDDIVELEAAHDAVLEAAGKTSGRIGRKAAQERLVQAQQHEQEVLDRVKFPTWSAYVMGASLLNIDPVAEQRLERARAELESAEAGWADLTRQLEADPDYSSLLDRLEAVFLAAFDILGGETEGDLEQRLRNHLVPDEDVSKQDIIDALIYQLGIRGVDLEEDALEDVVAGTADDFLGETADHWDKYRALQEEHVMVANELAGSERELQLLGGDPEDDTPEARQQKFEEAETRVADILADLEAVTQIEADLEGQVEARDMMLGPVKFALEAAHSSLAAAEESAADAFGGSTPAPEPPQPAAVPEPAVNLQPSYDRKPEVYDDLPYAPEGPDDAVEPDDDELDGTEAVEFYFLTRLASLRHASFAGSVPMLVDDVLGAFDRADQERLLAKLEEMSEAVQVIVLTDEDGAANWADGVGIERAATVTAAGAFAS